VVPFLHLFGKIDEKLIMKGKINYAFKKHLEIQGSLPFGTAGYLINWCL
jgi:hypothetical protein